MCFGDDDETENYDGGEADLIIGDNSLPLPPTGAPYAPGTAPNLSRIPADATGEVPIVTPPSG